MLAICVPTYNHFIGALILELLEQSRNCNVPIEIIVLDDGSKEDIKVKNQTNQFVEHIRYVELPENIGRAAIRNRFLNYTQQAYLLFLDCDAIIDSKTFISNYLEVIHSVQPSVICGGRIYPDESEITRKLFRWKYGVHRECRNETSRKQTPYTSFLTNNFVIKREVLEKIRFDERLKGYGHEDTLFGIALERSGIEIVHIHNPVLNGYIEDNSSFIQQTKEGIANLIRVERMYSDEYLLKKRIKLLEIGYKLNFFAPCFRFVYRLLYRPVERQILKGTLSLIAFDLYKLCYYFKLKKELE